MLLIDLIDVQQSPLVEMTTVELKASIKTMCNQINWQYDIDPLNERVFDRGQKMMNAIQEHVTELYSRDKNAALSLWENNCPFATPGLIPTFIFAQT